ncbi:MAG: hypothetical protein ACOYXT_19850 [Bacteroidota bacterium]
MSLDIIVYTRELSNDLIPKIQKRLNDFEMICELHPKFSFSDQTGFLPFKFQLTNPPFEKLRNKTLMSGFELYIDDFDFEEERKKAQPKPRFINKLTGRRLPDRPLVDSEIDKRLKDCKKIMSSVWHAMDSFEVRFASLTSAILTELTNGVCSYPADNIWYDNEGFVEKTWKEIKEYETAHLKERDLVFHQFEKWD